MKSGCASFAGLKSIAISYTPRLIVPVSTRTMNGTCTPSEVVTIATSDGMVFGSGSGLKMLSLPRPRPAGAAGAVDLYT
jgi:hypothetical protein